MARKALLAMVVLTLGGTIAQASDPVGIYAKVDKVVFEGSEGMPERIQIWGVFCTAVKQFGDEYSSPVAGCMYCSLKKGKEEACWTEWNDLKKIAGTANGVAFGSRYQKLPRVRPASEKLDNPDEWPLDFGLTKIEPTGYMIRKINTTPALVSPFPGATTDAGKVALTVRPIGSKEQKDAKYVFEITDGKNKETSEPIAAGEKETKWTPKMEAKAGGKYTWKVFAQAGEWKGPVATGEFTGK